MEIARQGGQPLKMRVAGKWMLRMIGIFNPFIREMVEMHYLLTEPVIMDCSAPQKLIGPIAKTPYPEGIRQTIAAARPEGHRDGRGAPISPVGRRATARTPMAFRYPMVHRLPYSVKT